MHLKYLSLLFIPFFVLLSCQPQNPNEAKYKAAYVQISKALDSGELNELDNNIANDAIDHQLDPSITDKSGLDGIKDMFRYYHRVFPDMKTTIHSMAVSGDTLFGYITTTGTTSEPFMGMPANTKTSITMVDVVVFKGDKMAEHWGFMNMTDAMQMMKANMPMEEGMKDEGMNDKGKIDEGMKNKEKPADQP